MGADEKARKAFSKQTSKFLKLGAVRKILELLGGVTAMRRG